MFGVAAMKTTLTMKPVLSCGFIAISVALLINSGFSVYMAAKQPDAKNLSVLQNPEATQIGSPNRAASAELMSERSSGSESEADSQSTRGTLAAKEIASDKANEPE
jgi:hypothetical protein